MPWLILVIVAFVISDFLILAWIFSRRTKRGLNESELEFVRKTWRTIATNQDAKHALLEADKLLDFVLTKRGKSGALGEKLKASEKTFSDLDGVWRAHKLRNRIAHEINFVPAPKETATALVSFRRALHDLGITL